MSPPPRPPLAGRGRDFELVTVLRSNPSASLRASLLEHDEYIKSYLLQQPDMTFATAVKITLWSPITPELIVQLTELKTISRLLIYACFRRFFGKSKNKNKSVA